MGQITECVLGGGQSDLGLLRSELLLRRYFLRV